MGLTENIEKFILGEDTYPGWFMDIAKSGRVTSVCAPNGTLIRIVVKTITGDVTAKKGDTVGLMNGDVIVIPADAAHKYM